MYKTTKNILLTFLLIIAITKTSNSQTIKEPSPILWYSINQADSLFKEKPRPMLIDIYTDWCSWCKHMMKTTFASKGIASYINQNFIPIQLDAETKDTLIYKGEKYVNQNKGRSPKHDLAIKLTGGRLSFPTIVYTDLDRNPYPVPGYQDVKNIEAYLVFFNEQVYRTQNINSFMIDFMFASPKRFKDEIDKLKLANKDFIPPDTSGTTKFYSFAEAEKLSKKEPRPFFLISELKWFYSCKLLKKITLKNPKVAELLNDKFYTVTFDAISQDTIKFLGYDYKPGKGNTAHELTQSIIKQNFIFPAFITISPKKQIINEVHGYLNADQLESILGYLADENYTKMPYEEYLKKRNSKKP